MQSHCIVRRCMCTHIGSERGVSRLGHAHLIAVLRLVHAPVRGTVTGVASGHP